MKPFTSLILLLGITFSGFAETSSLLLAAKDAGIAGGAAFFGSGNFIGAWRDANAKLNWEFTAETGGTAEIELTYSCAPNSGGTFVFEIGTNKFIGRTKPTGDWFNYTAFTVGSVAIQSGRQTATLRAVSLTNALMNVKAIRLSPLSGRVWHLGAPVRPLPLPAQVFVVPNFHPASCGWLANFSVERNYCANSYLDHLDRVRDDPAYAFALSECNNMIAILNFTPDRFAELKQRIKEGRVEPVNAFFLEPTVSLSGGEAIAIMGIEGLRWQQKYLGARPRSYWGIDTCGVHDQMPQILKLLGLDTYVFVRCSRADKGVFWSESPDGSRILTVCPGSYANSLGGLFSSRTPVNTGQLEATTQAFSSRLAQTPADAPLLVLGGQGDYSLAPLRREHPSEFLDAWKKFRPDCDVRFTGLSPYVDALLQDVKSEKVKLSVVRAGTSYAYGAFWINCPLVKSWYRRDEQALQAAEMLATIASLKGKYDYPVQPFYYSWLQMLLNMDRNTLWGAAGGMVFEDAGSWDARDRFEWVEKQSRDTLEAAAHEIAGDGESLTLFNPANWQRTDPLRLRLPEGQSVAGAKAESAGDGTTFYQFAVPGIGVVGKDLCASAPAAAQTVKLPRSIETEFYSAIIDPGTGSLLSLKVKPSGREMLGGPANVIVADKTDKRADNVVDGRSKRKRLASSSDFKSRISVTEGPLSITVEADGDFIGGGAIKRVTRFFKNHPRIEFETELNDLPDLSVVFAEFPLAQPPAEIRRGIPFGFSRDDNYIQGIVPAVRWVDYATAGKGGVALLDRGLPGREINTNIPIIYLLNSVDRYAGYTNSWLSGKGRHMFEYALVAHDLDWPAAHIPQLAWEYNCPAILITHCQPLKTQSFIQTSPNLIVEAMRRDGDQIELRLVEAFGQPGNAEVTVNLPHTTAATTDLLGKPVQKLVGGPSYRFPVRPQQIITIRCKTSEAVASIEPLAKWDALVPASKLAALNLYSAGLKGHPPFGQ